MTPDNTDIKRSRGGKWLAFAPVGCQNNAPSWLIEMERPSVRRKIGRGMPVFSRDEKWLALVNPSALDCARNTAGTAPVRVEVSVQPTQSGPIRRLQAFDYNSKSVRGRGIQDAAFSPDNRIFTAVSPTAILRWDVASGKLISRIEGDFFDFKEGLEGVTLFAGGRKIWISGGYDDNRSTPTRFYDARTAKRERIFNRVGMIEPTDERFYWAFQEDKLYRVSDDKPVFDLSQSRFAFSGDGKWLLLGHFAGAYIVNFQLLEVGTWHLKKQRKIAGVVDWRFDDANHVLTMDQQGRIYRWRLR